MDKRKFSMWRAIFSIVHLDHKIDETEKDFIESKVKSLSFEPEQIAMILEDLKNKKSFTELFKEVENKADRAFILHQIRVLGSLDGDYSEEERSMFKSVESSIMSSVNMQEMKTKIADFERESYHEDNVYEVSNEHSFFEKVYRTFQKIVNPGDYKKPN